VSKEGLAALKLAVAEVKSVITTLSDEEWSRPSGCQGWSVRDLVAHMSSNYKETVDPSPPPAEPINLPAERMMDMLVEPRKAWSNQQILDEYLAFCDQAVAVIESMQEEPLAPLGNLGAHPLHILGNAIVFDHYCHLRHDIGAGVQRAADLPRDPEALAAILEWMLMGLPQMCADALSKAPSQVVNLHFTGVAQGDFVLTPGAPLWTVMPGAQAGAPTVTSSAHDFVSWGTQRADWRKTSSIAGNGADAAGAVLDAINII